MKRLDEKRLKVFLLCLFIFTLSKVAFSAPVNLFNGYHFRDIRGPNTVDFYIGDVLAFGVSIEPAEGTAAEACQGEVCYSLFSIGDIVNPNEFARSIAYDSSLTDNWIITATNETDTNTVETNAVGNVGPLPFVKNTRIEGAGLTPTIKWDIPLNNTEPFTNLLVGVIDDITNERIFFSPYLDPSTTSFTIPENLLEETGSYVFRVMLVNRLGLVNPYTVNRSTTFINFRPLPEGSPPVVYCPIWVVDGVFQFNIDVEWGVPVFIDPEVAIGYEYRIGSEDTVKFASVTLPEVGDNLFDLYLFDGSDFYLVENNLPSGETYIFDSNGVETFKILGIEESAGLDPADVTAFITELTFTDSGQFTGTMTPISKTVTGAEIIEIDIKPGTFSNPINPRSKGKIPVAILSATDFYAPAEVDTDSLTFGPVGNESSLVFCNQTYEDVNDDGYDDFVCHFDTQTSGFQCGDEQGILRGQTVDETPIEGTELVRITSSGCYRK